MTSSSVSAFPDKPMWGEMLNKLSIRKEEEEEEENFNYALLLSGVLRSMITLLNISSLPQVPYSSLSYFRKNFLVRFTLLDRLSPAQERQKRLSRKLIRIWSMVKIFNISNLSSPSNSFSVDLILSFFFLLLYDNRLTKKNGRTERKNIPKGEGEYLISIHALLLRYHD